MVRDNDQKPQLRPTGSFVVARRLSNTRSALEMRYRRVVSPADHMRTSNYLIAAASFPCRQCPRPEQFFGLRLGGCIVPDSLQ